MVAPEHTGIAETCFLIAQNVPFLSMAVHPTREHFNKKEMLLTWREGNHFTGMMRTGKTCCHSNSSRSMTTPCMQHWKKEIRREGKYRKAGAAVR